jgi:hypothetical protein
VAGCYPHHVDGIMRQRSELRTELRLVFIIHMILSVGHLAGAHIPIQAGSPTCTKMEVSMESNKLKTTSLRPATHQL